MKEINDCDGVKAAVAQASSPAEERAIIARALELGCVEHIPDDWGIEVSSDGGNREDTGK